MRDLVQIYACYGLTCTFFIQLTPIPQQNYLREKLF